MKSRFSPARTLPDLKGRYFILSPCGSMLDITTVIAGHSHSAAISRALVTTATDGQRQARDIALQQGIGGLRGGPGTPGYWNVRDLAQTRSIAVIWNGNQHNADFLLASDQSLDLIPRGYRDPSVLPEDAARGRECHSRAFPPDPGAASAAAGRLTGA